MGCILPEHSGMADGSPPGFSASVRADAGGLLIDPARKQYYYRHSGLDPESSNIKYRRALRATGYPPSRV
jgi:hypothetical protein